MIVNLQKVLKMVQRLLFCWMGLSLISCEMKPKTPVIHPEKFDSQLYQAALKDAGSNLVLPTEDSIRLKPEPIVKTFLPEVDSIQYKLSYAKGKMDTVKIAQKKMVFLFDSEWAKTISMKLIPSDSTANIRILEVISPDSISEGPFEKEIQYKTHKTGIHKVVVGEDLENGKPWGGRFTYEVKLSW